jgi:metal-dependent amidase/aminoacylase/carboxypeptidase family protein
MALDPSIALGVRPLQLPDPLAQMAQVSQIQAAQRQGEAAQRQNEMAQIQLEQLKQDRLEMQNFQSQLEKSGGNPDLDLLAKTMLKSPKYFEKGFELTQKLKHKSELFLGRNQVEDLPIRLTSEDFAFYSQEIPVCFVRLGVGNIEKGITFGVHHQ